MDRSTVWAEIDSILAAIDPSRSSWVSLLESEALGSGGVSSEQASTSANAVLDFLNDVVSESDLQQMGILCPMATRHFLAAVTDLPKGIETVAASLTRSTTVETFLQRLCLQQHLQAAAFSKLRHRCLLDCLADVTDQELKEKYLVRKLGHRRRILACLTRLRLLVEEAPPAATPRQSLASLAGSTLATSTSTALSAASRGSNTSDGNIDAIEGNSNAEKEVRSGCLASGRLSKDHLSSTSTASSSSQKPVPKKSEALVRLQQRSQKAESKRKISSKQSLTFQPAVQPDWPHHPQVLLGGSAAYSVSYLGFRPVRNHTDSGEVQEVMRNFRCKSEDILKLPQICLSVCYLGVKFVNPDNEMVITEHRITDIYYASQDSVRRANFAYIAKDAACGGVHCCHCFACHSQDAAVLIINTLSQACSLANQLIEFNHSRREKPHTQSSAAGTRSNMSQ